jgi:hypothetical protein
MRAASLLGVLTALVLVAACGDDRQADAEAEPRPRAEAAPAVADTTPDPGAGLRLQQFGQLRTFPEAGFRVYWPSGCGQFSEQISDRATRRAEREFIYNCDRDGNKVHGVGVRVFQNAHDAEGNPPHPRLVTELIERQLRKSGTRILRQRPLEGEGMQGVDVQSGEVGGSGEVWIRGLLVGTDIFLLMAWDQRGGLFEDIEVVDFFASFRAGVAAVEGE